jgi:hypothetical protein
MAALEPGGDAAGAGQADLARIGLDRVGGLAVVGIGEPGAHRVAERPLLAFLADGEIGAGGLVQHRLEAIGLEPLERVGELVDGIVGPRLGAVAAAVAAVKVYI